jgi:molybdopterin-guanine dinucleotide biosynthesis protein A
MFFIGATVGFTNVITFPPVSTTPVRNRNGVRHRGEIICLHFIGLFLQTTTWHNPWFALFHPRERKNLYFPHPPRYRAPMSKTIGVVLAGGRSSRMQGNDKAFIVLAGRTLLARAIAALTPQVDALAINSNATGEHLDAFGLPLIPDLITGHQGPLAGMHAGLSAYPDDYVLTVAVDLPLLPHDLARHLKAGLQHRRCAYAACGTQHALALLWAPGMAREVEAFLQRGGRSLKEWLRDNGAAVDFASSHGSDLLLNINTPEDLRTAEQRLAAQAQQQQ